MTRPETPTPAVRVALLGCGRVGSDVARRLIDDTAELAARTGRALELVGIATSGGVPADARGIPEHLFTDDAETLVTGVDLVIDVMDGGHDSGALLRRAMEHGAAAVTADTALMAAEGDMLRDVAGRQAVPLHYEAAVTSAMPLLRPLRASLVDDTVHRVVGVVNGTTNHILDQMQTTGVEFEQALAETRRAGHGGPDLDLDVDNHDAAAKAAIIAGIVFHTHVDEWEVHREGIGQITADDVTAARTFGWTVKSLAVCERTPSGVSVRVHPALVPDRHPLAGVRGASHALFVQAETAGGLLLSGRSAPGEPTAAAVLTDVVAAARELLDAPGGIPKPVESAALHPVDLVSSRYFVRLHVEDHPGVLAAAAGVFADHGVSIEQVGQLPDTPTAPNRDGGEGGIRLAIVTHTALQRDMAATIAAVDRLDEVRHVLSVIRIEEDQDGSASDVDVAAAAVGV